MIEGLYSAATGMLALEGRQAVIANNIANASTPGFRSQNALQKGFYQMLLDRMASPAIGNREPGPGGGLKIVETYTDTRGGPVVTTGNALDVALVGPGFIGIATPAGDRFTRNGHFVLDGEGELSTVDGYKVQSEGGGAIAVSGRVEILGDGAVYDDGLPVGRIRLIEFEEPHMLSREGDALYAASEEALEKSATAGDTTVEPGALEMSNVQLPYEMAQMMLGLRMYSANQKVINSVDETLGRLINEVGAPV
jgi:flagellar basal-body rod protein FlgF